MSFLRVQWHHDLNGEPVDIYSQLDGGRFEIRKVEVFQDGTGQIAGPGVEQGDTFLSETPIPHLEVINMDPEFTAEEVSAEQFWDEWRKYAPTPAE